MIEMPRMTSHQSPLLRTHKPKSRDATYAGLALLAVLGMALVAFARGNVNQLFAPMQQKFTQADMCSNVDQLGYGAKAKTDCISHLPGLTFQPSFHSFSGYLHVGQDRDLFYWFTESQDKPEEKPLVFWMNGGPGCSGLDGLLSEHGPYLVYNDMSLRPNPHSLNKLANVVYFEAPFGVGFSKPTQGQNIVVGDLPTARDNAAMIREFLRQYPKFAKHHVYIASESYGGHYMPTLAEEILRGIDQKKTPHVNFKGMMVGNPFVDFWGNVRGSMNAYIGHGLVSLPMEDMWNRQCNKDASLVDVRSCFGLSNAITKKVGHMDPYAMDFTFCPTDSLENGNKKWTQSQENRRKKSFMMKQSLKKILQVERDDGYVACADNYMAKYLNRKDVQTALHAKNTKWTLCSDKVHQSWPSASWEYPMQTVYKRLAESGRIKLMVYSGDDDSVCSTYATQLWMWKLGFKAHKKMEWEAWYLKDQLAGYQTRFMSHDGLRTAIDFTTIHTAGHMVPQTQPERALKIYEAFLGSDPQKGFALGDGYY